MIGALDQFVGSFNRRVRSVGFMPCGDLILPSKADAPETACFLGNVGVLEIVAESLEESKLQCGPVKIVESAHSFLRAISGGVLTLRVTRVEKSLDLLSKVIVESIIGHGEASSDTLEKIK